MLAGGYHELLHGPEWRDCTDELLTWIKSRSKASATEAKL
jgi:hypothetical protein